MLRSLYICRPFAARLIALFLTISAIFLFASERISFAVRDKVARPLVVAFIDAPELMSWMENGRAFQLLDARPALAYEKGHIIEAVSAGRMTTYDAVGRDPVVVYCDRSPVSKFDPCFRAVVAALQSGTRDVYWFKGGLSAWRSAGFALDGPEPERPS